MKIIVARLGISKDIEKDMDVIKQAGANAVCTSVNETNETVIHTIERLTYAENKEAAG